MKVEICLKGDICVRFDLVGNFEEWAKSLECDTSLFLRCGNCIIAKSEIKYIKIEEK